MIPDGPLHPADLGLGLLLGATVAVVFWQRRLWLPAASLAAVGGYGERHGWDVLVGSFVDRPATGLAIFALVAVAATGWMLERRTALGHSATVPGLTVVSLVGVWAIVPDTEAPIVFAATLGVALVASPRREQSTYPGGAVLALAVVAAAVGSVGRPERLWPAIVAIVVIVGLGLAAMASVRSVSGRAVRGRRRASVRA